MPLHPLSILNYFQLIRPLIKQLSLSLSLSSQLVPLARCNYFSANRLFIFCIILKAFSPDEISINKSLLIYLDHPICYRAGRSMPAKMRLKFLNVLRERKKCSPNKINKFPNCIAEPIFDFFLVESYLSESGKIIFKSDCIPRGEAQKMNFSRSDARAEASPAGSR